MRFLKKTKKKRCTSFASATPWQPVELWTLIIQILLIKLTKIVGHLLRSCKNNDKLVKQTPIFAHDLKNLYHKQTLDGATRTDIVVKISCCAKELNTRKGSIAAMWSAVCPRRIRDWHAANSMVVSRVVLALSRGMLHLHYICTKLAKLACIHAAVSVCVRLQLTWRQCFVTWSTCLLELGCRSHRNMSGGMQETKFYRRISKCLLIANMYLIVLYLFNVQYFLRLLLYLINSADL